MTPSGIDRPDDVYARLLALYEGCDAETKDRVSALLVMSLLREIDDGPRVIAVLDAVAARLADDGGADL